MLKKMMLAILALTLVCSSLPVEATCAPTSELVYSAADADSADWFEEMTREEYITEYAQTNSMTYEAAEEEIDSAIVSSIAALPAPMSWYGDTVVGNGDNTSTVYGRVSATFVDASGMSATYKVQAIQIKSHYGATWSSCNENGTFTPGSGSYTLIGSCTASVISTRNLRMVLDGYFEISKSVADSIGVDLGVCQYSYTSGTTMYYRRDVYDVHIETTTVAGG